MKDTVRKLIIPKFPRRGHKVWPKKEAIFSSTSLSLQDLHHPTLVEDCERQAESEEADEKPIEAAGKYERQPEAREADKRQPEARGGGERSVEASRDKRQPMEVVEKLVLSKQEEVQLAIGEDVKLDADGKPLPETFIINLSYI